MIEAEVRKAMHKMMKNTLAEQATFYNWWYLPVRPMYVPSIWVRGKAKKGDCSKGCQYLAKWSGAPDPMGRHFDAYGNSTTMTFHCHHLDHMNELKVGDYITFGYLGRDHAACVMGLIKNSKGVVVDVLLWSFGHQGAPNDYHLSYDRRQRYYLRNPIPHTLTAAEQLQAKTGFFAWAQWKQGKGAWRGHGKGNAKLRPNVPKRPPLRWWRRYAQLYLSHRKANQPTT